MKLIRLIGLTESYLSCQNNPNARSVIYITYRNRKQMQVICYPCATSYETRATRYKLRDYRDMYKNCCNKVNNIEMNYIRKG